MAWTKINARSQMRNYGPTEVHARIRSQQLIFPSRFAGELGLKDGLYQVYIDGKGENDYDCGPDAIYGMSSEGHSYEDAVAAYVKAVLRERAKRSVLAPEHRTVLTEVAP